MGLFIDVWEHLHGDKLQDWVRDQVLRLDGNFTRVVPASIVGLLLAWFLGSCIWYRYLSPISDIPGPFLASFSRLWLIQSLLRGRSAIELSELHERYGE